MNKTEVKRIENQARKLMNLDHKIWKKEEWQSGDDVDIDTFKKELSKSIGLRSLGYIYYHILEDANFHSLNELLEEMHAFIGSYGESQKEFDDYTESGGKTWDL